MTTHPHTTEPSTQNSTPHDHPGRPRALDDSKQREICALISAGCSIERAARYVGCNRVTIHRERERNEAFAENLRRAEMACELGPLHAIQKAAQTHWRAAAWMLERTHPESFARLSPKGLGGQDARDLIAGVARLLEAEIEDPFLAMRVCQRVRSLMEEATRHTWETPRTSTTVRRALKTFELQDRANGYVDEFGLPVRKPKPKPGSTDTSPPIQRELQTARDREVSVCKAQDANGATTKNGAPAAKNGAATKNGAAAAKNGAAQDANGAATHPASPIRNPKSEIRNRPSPIRNPQSEIRNQEQSDIRNRPTNGAAAKKNGAPPRRTANSATPATPPETIFRDRCETLIQKLQETPDKNAATPHGPPTIMQHENEVANGLACLT